MAKNLYIGVASKARKMKAGYVGVGGKARKIKKIYVGVGGKARLVYTSYVAVTGINVTWSYASNGDGSFILSLDWTPVPTSASNPGASCTFATTSGSTYAITTYFSVTEVYTTVNGTKYLTGLRVIETNKSPDKVTFVITIKHGDGITYKATCVYNYNASKVWTVTVAKQ